MSLLLSEAAHAFRALLLPRLHSCATPSAAAAVESPPALPAKAAESASPLFDVWLSLRPNSAALLHWLLSQLS